MNSINNVDANIMHLNPFIMPSVTLNTLDKLPRESGIYFVISETEGLLYIGKAICLHSRWQSHHKINEFRLHKNVRLSYLAFAASNDEELKAFENECIGYFKPSLNRPALIGTSKDIKVSFYLTSEQAEKLDDLAYEHKKRTGKRINRNAIVRHLIDHCSINDLQASIDTNN